MGQRFWRERMEKVHRRRHWYAAGRVCGCHICWTRAGFGRGPYDRSKEKRDARAEITIPRPSKDVA